MAVAKKLTLALILCLGAALAGCAGGSDSGSAGGGTSGAGGDAILLPVAEDPTVTFRLWFRVGSQNDPTGKEGLALLTASMLSDGSTQNNSYEEVLEKLYPMAAGYGSRVDKEMTTFTGRTHKDNLDGYFALFSDAFLRPAFDSADFERLKSAQLSALEKNLRYASDEELGKAALHEFVFRGTPYAHPPLGTAQGLKSITLDDVKAFYEQHYTQGNTEVALAGGYSDELLERFQSAVGELGEGDEVTPPAISPAPIEAQQVLLVNKPGADASISFGFPIEVSRGERDFYALWIANAWLGEHRNSSSHLYKVIREARGMNYGDYSYIEVFPQGGRRQFPPTNVARRHQLFEIWIRTLPNDQAHFALRAAVRELQDLVDGGMSEEEFELTRSFLSKYILHYADNNTDRLGYAVDDRFYGIDGDGHLARFRKMMDEITREEVNAALKKYLRWDRMKIAMVTGDAEGLKQALASDAPSPMTYASPKSAELLAEDEVISTFPLGIDAANVEILPVDQAFEGQAPAAQATAEETAPTA